MELTNTSDSLKPDLKYLNQELKRTRICNESFTGHNSCSAEEKIEKDKAWGQHKSSQCLAHWQTMKLPRVSPPPLNRPPVEKASWLVSCHLPKRKLHRVALRIRNTYCKYSCYRSESHTKYEKWCVVDSDTIHSQVWINKGIVWDRVCPSQREIPILRVSNMNKFLGNEIAQLDNTEIF